VYILLYTKPTKLRYSPIWDIAQRCLAVGYWPFGKAYGSIFRDHAVK